MAFTLDAMSIYGQDTRILESWYNRQNPRYITTASSPQEPSPQYKPPAKCYFLDIPLEIRHQIYRHALPWTSEHSSKGVYWHRGSTALLATNAQVHDEASPFIYSDNVFTIDVIYDCATFNYKWALWNNLLPNKRLAFPEQIGARYIQLLRKLHVSIHHLDQYTGMIKYNYSGSGLTDGLRDQVQFLCQCLDSIPEIRQLNIMFKDDTHTPEISRRVLSPFLSLTNVRAGEVGGDPEPVFRGLLSDHLNPISRRTAISLADLPPELRRQIYRTLSTSTQDFGQRNLEHERNGKPRERPALCSLIALSFTNHAFYSEVQDYIFSNGHFELSVMQNLTYRFGLNRSGPNSSQTKPVAVFPQGICVSGLQRLRRLSIDVAHIPSLSQPSQQTDLERFFDTLVRILEPAPLKSLSVRYASNKKTSSGDSPTSSPLSRDSLAQYVRSLDISSHQTDVQLGVQSTRMVRDSFVSYSTGSSAHTSRTSSPAPSVTSSPTAMDASYQVSSSLLQTPTISYLVAKLNPIMARIKAQEDGRASFHQYSRPGSITRLRLRDSSPLRGLDAIETSTTLVDIQQSGMRPDDHGSVAPMLRREVRPRSSASSMRSSPSVKRNRQNDLLFPDVPI